MKNFFINKKGLTLVEVAIAAMVFLISISGVLAGFVSFMRLNENSRNFAQVNFCARQVVENIIRQHSPDEIAAFNAQTIEPFFTGPVLDSVCPDCPNGIGRTIITPRFKSGNDDTILIDIRTVICWQEVDGRIIGEARLNLETGVLELIDLNGNHEIDSPVMIRTSATPF